jgi:hypothetical protein
VYTTCIVGCGSCPDGPAAVKVNAKLPGKTDRSRHRAMLLPVTVQVALAGPVAPVTVQPVGTEATNSPSVPNNDDAVTVTLTVRVTRTGGLGFGAPVGETDVVGVGLVDALVGDGDGTVGDGSDGDGSDGLGGEAATVVEVGFTAGSDAIGLAAGGVTLGADRLSAATTTCGLAAGGDPRPATA